jgi:4-coumarate--CoA ligase
MVMRSELPDLDIPQTNILDYLFPSNTEISDKPLWIDAANTSYSLSPRAALQWIKRLGFGMQRLGIQRDDVCMIFSPNHIYVPVAYLGFVGYGASFSGMNPNYTVQGEQLPYSILYQ